MNDRMRSYEAPVPVLRLGGVLLVTLQGELHDMAAERLQHDVLEEVASSSARGVVVDVSGVEVVDSFLGRVISEIATGSALLAAPTVVAGMRPSVAITLVELGLPLTGLRTALNAEQAMGMFGRDDSSSALRSEERSGDVHRD